MSRPPAALIPDDPICARDGIVSRVRSIVRVHWPVNKVSSLFCWMTPSPSPAWIVAPFRARRVSRVPHCYAGAASNLTVERRVCFGPERGGRQSGF